MYRYILMFFALLLLIPVLPTGAEDTADLEHLILQQHLTQKELERNLAVIKSEESKLLADIAQLDMDMDRQALIIAANRRHAGEIARSYYTGQRSGLLTLLFDTKNFNTFLVYYNFLQLIFEKDIKKLEQFQAERQKAVELQALKQTRLAEVKSLRSQYETRLAEMIAVRTEKEQNLQKLPDPTAVQALMDHLLADWQKKGLPAFRSYFGVLTKVMFQIPEMITPDRIKPTGFLSQTLTIKEDDFNQFLVAKDPLFQQSHFSFDNNQLIVEGSYEQMNIKMVGEYQLVSPTELQFHITQLFYDGFQLPETTVAELEKEFDLGFYPSLISPNIKVEGISLLNKELSLQIKLSLPFSLNSEKN